jgi:hypothetical protein
LVHSDGAVDAAMGADAEARQGLRHTPPRLLGMVARLDIDQLSQSDIALVGQWIDTIGGQQRSQPEIPLPFTRAKKEIAPLQ